MRLRVESSRGLQRIALVGTVTADYGKRRFCENLQVEPSRSVANVVQIHADHLIKGCPAPPVDLPFSGDSGFHFQYSAPMPKRIGFKLIRYRRSGSDQRHLTFEDVNKLWQFIETALAEETAYQRDPWVIRDLVRPPGR